MGCRNSLVSDPLPPAVPIMSRRLVEPGILSNPKAPIPKAPIATIECPITERTSPPHASPAAQAFTFKNLNTQSRTANVVLCPALHGQQKLFPHGTSARLQEPRTIC